MVAGRIKLKMGKKMDGLELQMHQRRVIELRMVPVSPVSPVALAGWSVAAGWS